jgi:hypothetical protein
MVAFRAALLDLRQLVEFRADISAKNLQSKPGVRLQHRCRRHFGDE